MLFFFFFHLSFLLGIDVLNFFVADVVVLLNEGVESILDLVFGTAREVLADFRPLAANFAKELQDLSVFLFVPIFLFDAGIELVDEPFADLLAILGAHHLGEQFPVLAVFFNEFADSFVFFRGPYFVVFAELRQPSVSVQALVLVTVSHQRGNFCPFFRIVLVQFQ
jgi:hypothetical protein